MRFIGVKILKSDMTDNKMFKATGNTLFESEFLDARIKQVLGFTFRCAAVSSALTLALAATER